MSTVFEFNCPVSGTRHADVVVSSCDQEWVLGLNGQTVEIRNEDNVRRYRLSELLVMPKFFRWVKVGTVRCRTNLHDVEVRLPILKSYRSTCLPFLDIEGKTVAELQFIKSEKALYSAHFKIRGQVDQQLVEQAATLFALEVSEW